MRPSLALRVVHINLVLLRHGLEEVVLTTHLFRPVRFLMYLSPGYWLRNRNTPRGVRIRRALEDLGPIFVKFGQALSTRRDLLPADVAGELARLQDRVAPFPGGQARAIIRRAYGKPLEQIFRRFDEIPLASASIAQVHTARLKDEREVVVKVLRPAIESKIRRDVALLHYLAGLAERYWREGRRLRVRDVVAEFEKTLYDELDLLREAANASQLRRNFQDSELLYVPEIDWPLSRRTVMVMERIHGIPVSDVAALRAAGIDMRGLAERGVEIFFTQVFRHNFFHADMHPGNIFVSPAGRYIAVDFGIMGTLNPVDQRYLAENFLAFFRRDYRRVAELHVESGWVPAGTRIDEFESAIRTVCEPIFERPLKDISFGFLLVRLFQTARRFNMEVQPQLVLLQKTFLNIEGLGRQLYPDLDLWQTAKPFLERWMSEQVGLHSFLHTIRTNLPAWGEKLPELPELVHDVLDRARHGRLEVHWRSEELTRLREEMHHANRRTTRAVTGAALLVSGTLLTGAPAGLAQWTGGTSILGWLLSGVGVLLLLAAWRRGPR
ncbi:putative protein kinase UbiB [bacterium BMS3Bbin12]|nr:putative protein kinase UbiB [bacterium BMS3Abin12]GBE48876.1 putative protein kinase UbiB [bacterium BMS3Bbin12]GBE49780.1 putative protein kinase UbiB [bacterium BMS3Bbin13]